MFFRSLYLSVVHCTKNGKVLLTDFDKLPTIEVMADLNYVCYFGFVFDRKPTRTMLDLRPLASYLSSQIIWSSC